MSIVCTLPQAIVAVVSSISIILQTIKNRKKYIEISSDEISDDIVDDARFSTVKRDVAKLGITILQTGLYIFLFFWKFRNENKLNFDTISPGILAICWYCSIWDFISFSSVSKLIYKIYKQKTFEDDELDLLPFAYQARSLYNAFKKTRGSKLLYRILVANKRILALQLLFTMIAATLYYAPMIFLYRFLSFIQTRPENGSLELGFLYILGMLISYVLLHFTVAQNWYWASSVLNVSVMGMLNSEIYSKSLKRIVSHVSNVKDESNKSDDNLDAADDDNKSEDNLDAADDDNTSVGKISNLMSIDSSRISDFCVWWTSALDSPIELIVGIYFLYQLLAYEC
ncbi:hypothetical protein C2G38_2155729 [Gigaspora rosea]|uniref:Uncharacterized protein n=1 Tax=Gigaspora rosea TaxID=44941 RepID=A0A397W9Y9_9GLOM|nr:hypothetical protein C2G38_2155729 [Gigaspora rosea]